MSEVSVTGPSFALRLSNGEPSFVVFDRAAAAIVENRIEVRCHTFFGVLRADVDDFREESRMALEALNVQDTYGRMTTIELNAPMAAAFLLATPYVGLDHLIHRTATQQYPPYLTEIFGVELPGIGVATVRIASVGLESMSMYGSDGEAITGMYTMHSFG